ncbi:MAG: RNA-binding S4 domain-containing protein [Pikeienuella sp.]
MAENAVRIDKWLWRARFFKTRTLATKIVSTGVRVDGARVTKPGTNVKPGDTLTFAQGSVIRVIRIVALGDRRGPASEAVLLYEDLDPPQDKPPAPPRVGPRPTKKDRRALDQANRGES